MFARKLRIERVDEAGQSSPCPIHWIDNFAMRNFTNDAIFDDTLPVGDGLLEAGFASLSTGCSRRWLVEKGFGWLKQTGPLRQVKLRGLEKIEWLFVFSCAAHNLIRLPKLMTQLPGRLIEQCV